VDMKSKDGWTALMYASMNGFVSIVDLLVAKGRADVNNTDRLHRTALHWAARFNNVKVAQKLLSLRVKVDSLDIESISAGELANRYGNH
jgi:ankyrin repeat protein